MWKTESKFKRSPVNKTGDGAGGSTTLYKMDLGPSVGIGSMECAKKVNSIGEESVMSAQNLESFAECDSQGLSIKNDESQGSLNAVTRGTFDLIN